MCNIAGYAGTRRAAPILIGMMKKQEGWGGGYYTGIATIHEDWIHYAKLTGDTDRLAGLTEAMNLPGTVGIIHSRSRSGGGDRWAHPFIAGKQGRETAAYVANGSYGSFDSRIAELSAIAAGLSAQGYELTSREMGPVSRYPMLPDGSCAHMSDVMAQLIAKKIDDGQDACSAMSEAFCQMPSEIVGLLLSLTEPDCIVFSRINQPMNVSFAEHGAYLATTPQAFPEDAGKPTVLPACSGGRVYRDRFEARPYTNPPGSVAPVTAGVAAAAYEKISAMLTERKYTLGELSEAIVPLFSPADCCPSALLAYHVLYSLEKEGRLETALERVEGVREDLDAPKLYARMKKQT